MHTLLAVMGLSSKSMCIGSNLKPLNFKRLEVQRRFRLTAWFYAKWDEHRPFIPKELRQAQPCTGSSCLLTFQIFASFWSFRFSLPRAGPAHPMTVLTVFWMKVRHKLLITVWNLSCKVQEERSGCKNWHPAHWSIKTRQKEKLATSEMGADHCQETRASFPFGTAITFYVIFSPVDSTISKADSFFPSPEHKDYIFFPLAE